MPGERIIIDGLWRCLCPAVDAATLSRALKQCRPFAARKQPRSCSSRPSISPRIRSFTSASRCLQQDASRSKSPNAAWADDPGPSSPTTALGYLEYDSPLEKSEAPLSARIFAEYTRAVRNVPSNLPPSVFTGDASYSRAIDHIPTESLLNSLRDMLGLEGQYQAISNLVTYLITRRRMRPDGFFYECLIRANIDPKYGSALVTRTLLEDMARAKIAPTSAIYHAALDVLSVHPDYLLQNEIRKAMKLAWINPNLNGTIAIIIGLLRDKQPELAMDAMEEAMEKFKLPSWLYDVVVLVFAELGYHEESLLISQERRKLEFVKRSSNSIWYLLLSAFARSGYYEGTKYVWETSVASRDVKPSDGLLTNVLNTAAQHHDTKLAGDAITLLSQRGRRLELHHLEPLIDIYTARGDLRKSFQVLCVMAKAGLRPDSSTTRPIFQLLKDNTQEQLEATISTVCELRTNYKVPIAAFNVFLEVTIFQRGFRPALDLYRSVRQVCDEPPDMATFNLLLSKCVLPKSLRFILAEMEAFRIDPDLQAYDKIILIYALDNRLDRAFHYLAQMKTSGKQKQLRRFSPTKYTVLALVRACMLVHDDRVRGLIQDCMIWQMDVEEQVHEMMNEIRAGKEMQIQKPEPNHGLFDVQQVIEDQATVSAGSS